MKRLSLPDFPGHLIHPDLGVTMTVLLWAVSGGLITGLGGLMAARAKGNCTRLAIGMALTLVGVVLVGSAVLYHNSLNQTVAPDGR